MLRIYYDNDVICFVVNIFVRFGLLVIIMVVFATVDHILVIYVTSHRCEGDRKNEFNLTLGFPAIAIY